jgi:uncharacterized membrane protein (UPF0127 family)
MNRRHLALIIVPTLLIPAIAGCAPGSKLPTIDRPAPEPNHSGADVSPTASVTPAETPDTAADLPARVPMKAAPTATLPDGWVVTLELAETEDEQRQGLMFRPSLPDDQGMLFLYEQDWAHTFWMKNTFVALDIIFLAADGTVADMIEDVRPCKVEPCPRYTSRVPVRAVLEVVAGTAKAHGVAVGKQLSFEGVRGFPE